jgi:hypothetical protein
MTACVAGESHSAPETIEYRDLFCDDCGQNEYLKGTAAELAEKVLALGWVVREPKRLIVRCPDCGEVWS